MFLAPRFFWGEGPRIFGLGYKIQTVSDHVAKFHGDRPRDLGERVAKEKRNKEKTSLAFYKTARTTVRAAYKT